LSGHADEVNGDVLSWQEAMSRMPGMQLPQIEMAFFRRKAA
jgi:hypothetical protein